MYLAIEANTTVIVQMHAYTPCKLFLTIHRCCNKQLRVSVFEKNGELHGRLVGLSSDDVAYSRQAAIKVSITVGHTIVLADIVKRGVSNKGLDVVKIKFDSKEGFDLLKSEIKNKSSSFHVDFILKHSYFRNLHKSLDRMNTKIVERLIPLSIDTKERIFPPISYPKSSLLLLDKEYQLLALKKMMACDSSAPFLVTGPFGTGKTRLLAAAAVNFLRDHNNRVLVCTSHLPSADAYIDTWFGPLMKEHCIPHHVKPLRLVGDRYRYRGKFSNLAKSGYKQQDYHAIKECRLIITTFLTAPQLIRMKVKPFTHILIDEGAQTREPEAIAPLGLADDNTKIVIAGDHLQVIYSNI